MENIGTAIELMLVGLPTVFLVLILIIYFSKLLIFLVNKYLPEELVDEKTSNSIDPKKAAAISAAVSIVTNGKGSVSKIEKI